MSTLLCRLVVMSATLGDDLAERLVRIMSSSARTTQASQNGLGPADSEAAESASGSEQSTSEADPAGGCRLLTCEGRMFPVRTKYLGAPGAHWLLPVHNYHSLLAN